MKKLCLVLALMMCIVSASYATNARLAGMQVPNWMVDDDANIWFSPAYISDYTGRIWGEFGDLNAGVASNQWGGGSTKWLAGWLGNTGIFFNRPYVNNAAIIGADLAASNLTAIPTAIGARSVGSAAAFPATGVNMSAATPTNKIDLLYGFDIAKLIRLGIGVNFADAVSNYSDVFATSAGAAANDGSITYNRGTYEANASAGLTISQLGPIPQLDIVGSYGMPIVNNYYLETAWVSSSANKTEERSLANDGTYYLNLGARLKLMLWNLKFLVNGSWNIQNLSSVYKERTDSNADGTMEKDFLQNRKTTINTINAGIAFNNQVTDKTLVILGVGATIQTYEMNGTETDPMSPAVKIESTGSGMQFGIPVNLAVEHQLPWWGIVGRAGLAYTISVSQQSTGSPAFNAAGTLISTNDNVSQSDVTSALAASLGLSKQFTDTLSCDLVVRQNANTGLLNSLTTQMSIVYKFN